VGASSVIHALALGTLLSAGVRSAAGSGPDLVAVDLAEVVDLLPAIMPPAVPLPIPAARADEALVARPLDAPEGERQRRPRTVAPREGDTVRARRRQPIRQDGGHVRELATPRPLDAQSRVADATDAQPRGRTSTREASPQADRRERDTGIGDSVRDGRARPPSAAAPEPPPAPAAAADVAGNARREVAPASIGWSSPGERQPRPSASRPLAVADGARSFDIEARRHGPTMRAASSAAHPASPTFLRGCAGPRGLVGRRGPGSAPVRSPARRSARRPRCTAHAHRATSRPTRPTDP
jgi:hypothetical protein